MCIRMGLSSKATIGSLALPVIAPAQAKTKKSVKSDRFQQIKLPGHIVCKYPHFFDEVFRPPSMPTAAKALEEDKFFPLQRLRLLALKIVLWTWSLMSPC